MNKIDLKEDSQRVLEHIVKRIEDFGKGEHTGPGKNTDPVVHITIGFQFDQAGWIAFVLDTRPNGSPDGEWTTWISQNVLEFDHWFSLLDELDEDGTPLHVMFPDGSKQVMKEYNGQEIAWLIGEMLKNVLLKAKEEGVFSQLYLTKKCTMGVEELCGAYGWPKYEKRFEEGSVV